MNIPESYIDAIEKLVGEDGLYPSRSELIRSAVREFLLRELRMAKSMIKYEETEIDDFDSENFVQIPIENKDKKEPIRSFKTYKILRRLEISDNSSESGDLNEVNRDYDDFEDDEFEKFVKLANRKPKEHKTLTLEEKRKKFPNAVEYKFMNEGRRGELLNI